MYMNNLNTEESILLEEEFEREKYFEKHIKEQFNIDYLKGFKKGINTRKDIEKSEKRYYSKLIDKRIDELTQYNGYKE